MTGQAAQDLPEVLVVEDDPALRNLLGAALADAGYAVSTAKDRQGALAVLRDSPAIEIVVLDLGLPPCPHAPDEGLAALAEFDVLARPLKTVVLTGQNQEAAALAAIRAGAFDFLAKPASLEAICAAIARARLFAVKERQLRQAGHWRVQVDFDLGEGLKALRAEAEERLIRLVLRETGFNVVQTARRLGIKRENVYYFLRKHGLERDVA